MRAPDPHPPLARPADRRPDPGVWHRFGRQLAHPEGLAGHLTGWLMAQVNRTPNRLAIDALQPTCEDHVLEIGFGPGAGLAELARRVPRGRIFGLDASPAMLWQARRRNAGAITGGRMVLAGGDVRALPWADASFHKVLAVNVAYFFDAEGRAAAEVFRVLAPGGRAAFYVTDRSTMETWPFAAAETHATYAADDLRRLLKAAGFPEEAVVIQSVELPFGVKGLIAVARRPLA